MKYSDLEEGKMYTCMYYNSHCIMRLTGNRCNYVYKKKNYHCGGDFSLVKSDFIPATLLEERWLEACEREQRFVPCPVDVVVNDYSIF